MFIKSFLTQEPPVSIDDFLFFFAESTHSVDGSNLWSLKLDQDLVDTLRVSFPQWNFGSSTVVAAVEDLNNNNTSSTNNNTIIVETTQRKPTNSRQSNNNHYHQRKSESHRKNYSKSSSILSNDKKMAEGKFSLHYL